MNIEMYNFASLQTTNLQPKGCALFDFQYQSAV